MQKQIKFKKSKDFSDTKMWQLSESEEAPKTTSKKYFQEEMGSTGTPIMYGYISEEINPKLRGVHWSKVYDEMRKTDAQVNASLLAMELPIRATKWYVEPAKNENGETEDTDKQIALFVEKSLFEYMDNTWDDLLREVLTMLPFGFSVFEKVFWMKRTDEGDKIILQKLAFRKQSTINNRTQKDNTPWVTQMLQTPATSGVNKWSSQISIPAEKLVIFSHRREWDNYEWVAVLRSAYKHRFIKDKLYKYDAIRHERQGVGIPVIYMPDGATEWDKAYAEKIVKNIRATEQTGVVMPWSKSKWWEFEYADLRAWQSTDFDKSIEHHNREIVKNILAQFLELGNTASGSRSLGESQTAYFLMSLEAVAKYICDIFNRHIIRQLTDLNFDTRRYPLLRFESLNTTNKKDLVDMVSSLVSGGILSPDDTVQGYMRDLLDLPAVEAVDQSVKANENHDHKWDSFFDNAYFNELSNMVNNDFIKKVQNDS